MAAQIVSLDEERLAKKVRRLDALEHDTRGLRIELGRELHGKRKLFPASKPKIGEPAWRDFLKRIGLTRQRAHELIDDAIRAEDLSAAGQNRRDTYCTPQHLTAAIGRFDLDPCSNARSTVQAHRALSLDRGEDGLAVAKAVKPSARVFLNPPYSDVLPWVRAYKHTRFCFLLKFDPSTAWCDELLDHTELVLFPRDKRISFVPPDGVRASSNQFPHGLFYAHDEDSTPEIRAICRELVVRARAGELAAARSRRKDTR